MPKKNKGRIVMIKTVLKIDGMMCSMCEAHINDAIRQNFAVKKVTSSHSGGKTVILSENELDRSEIERVIGETGYELKDITTETVEGKKGFFGLFGKK